MKVSEVIAGWPPLRKRFQAADNTSSRTSSRNSRMPTDAMVSNLRCPYGCSTSGGASAMRTPTIATTLEAVSVWESKPSESTVTAHVVKPSAILAAATARLRKRTRKRTDETSEARVLTHV